jgi:quinol monooxygenase YgiN
MSTGATHPATDRHVVTVVFQVRPEHRTEFRGAVLDNAATSLASEPGCLVFDVCESQNGAEFFLYELYENTAAFEKHLTTMHFKAFDAACAAQIVSKRVARYERLRAANIKD